MTTPSIPTDPRGPLRKITAVGDLDSQTVRKAVTLDCGHTSSLNGLFTYRIGAWTHCYACRLEADATPNGDPNR